MDIRIETTIDDYDCETCGWDTAEGGRVKVDGKVEVEVTAVAHCYNATSASVSDLLVLTLRKLGHTVYVDGEPYHVCNTNAEEEALST